MCAYIYIYMLYVSPTAGDQDTAHVRPGYGEKLPFLSTDL